MIMRIVRAWPVLLLLLAVIPSASAHVIVTAKPPAGPIPWDAPTKIDVTVRVSCSDLESEFMGTANLELALTEPPAWLNATGEKISIGQTDCDPTTGAGASTCSPAPTCASDYPYASKT